MTAAARLHLLIGLSSSTPYSLTPLALGTTPDTSAAEARTGLGVSRVLPSHSQESIWGSVLVVAAAGKSRPGAPRRAAPHAGVPDSEAAMLGAIGLG